MRFKATHDPLTCLWNRGMILDIPQREVDPARRDGEKSGVTIVLVDNAKRAESIRHAIQARPVESAAGAVPVSMSLGVAGTEDWQELNAEQLIHEADLALYRAKHLGRNRSVIARPSGLEEVQTVNCVGRPSPCHLRNRLSRPLKSLAAPAASSAASPHSSLVHASRAMLPVACKLLPGSKRRSDF